MLKTETMRTSFARFIPVLLLLLIFAGPLTLHAQKGKKDKQYKGSVEKIMRQADQLFSTRRYTEAEEAYREVLKKEPENYHATYRVAKCNWQTREYEEAAKWYEACIQLDPNKNDTVYFDLGVAYKKLNRYNDAREMFIKFRKEWNFKDEYARRVKLEIKGCDFAEEELQKEPEWTVSPLSINSGSGDQWPFILNQNTQDSFLVFTSHRTSPQGGEFYSGKGETSFSDLWYTRVEDDSTFASVENLGQKVNTKQNDGAATFRDGGMTMYYSICNQSKDGYGCSIYESRYDPVRKQWGKPKMVEGINSYKEIVINSRGKTRKVPTYDVQPSLSADGNTLYFVSDRDGGQGDLDIWYSTWDGSKWSEPKNAGENVNTPFNDIGPFVSRTEDALYFASEGRVGFGGYDLYKSFGAFGDFEEPVNLGHPVNSSYNDFGGYFFRNDSMMYYTSDRPDGSGRDDIYLARRKEAPPVEVTVHGLIRDTKSKQPIPFAIAILFEIDFEGDLIPIDTFNTDQSGSYNFPLDVNKDYKVLGNAPEYLANEAEFSTKGIKETVDLEQNIDIYLERIELGKPIVLNNIYYDYDKADLRDESKMELDHLIRIMSENPNIKIEIGSHTDTNGSESYNKELSERRAKSVVIYLMENGISGERMSWFGYGESQPLVYPEMSDEDEQLNRRSEFRIMSIDF